ncbi:hypothetical protein SO802_010119 [Lithocarpus litseifolius]|uniref:RNase H type-1 domain-containing protein n=1 Tax=Lithocarpus litseifolius TaxID=425828 RepID=A0AAW2DDF2_9ROSI
MGDHVDEMSGKEKNQDRESKTRESVNYGNPIEEINIQHNHVPATTVPTRVSNNAKRVLPSWTSRCRPATQSLNTPTENIIGKKRDEDIEAKTASWALSFALDVGVKRAVLEGDSMIVIKGLREEERLLVLMGLLIEEAKQLSQQFEKLLYSHAKRDCNVLAHSLARHAAGIPDLLVWMENVPPQFHDVFQADLLGLFE